MSLERTKVAVLVEELYDERTLWYPLYRVREAGATVDLVGTGDDAYCSRHDLEVRPDYTVDHAVASNYSGVVVPAGYAVDRMRLHRPMSHFVERIHDDGGVCGAVGHGAWLFASAGLVDGREATGVRSIREDLENAGATWVDRSVVVDGRIITSQSSENLPDFGRTFVDELRDAA